MARHSPEKPSSVVLGPPRRRAQRNKVRATHHVPRYLNLSSLSSYSERTDKVNKSIGSRSQRANASITTGQGRHVPQYAYVIPLPRPSHPQDATTLQPEVPSKRPYPISLHSNDHHESRPPQKRHCGRGDDVPGLFKWAPPKVLSVPLPSGGSLPSIPRDLEPEKTVPNRAQKSSCRSIVPVIPWSPAESSREKDELDMSVRSMGYTRIISTKRGLFDGAPRHQQLSESSKTSSNKENLLQNPTTVAARILRFWLFLFVCLLGAFIGSMVLHSHLAPEFPAAKWELKDHESLHCSGDKIKTCSW
ncbi:hypothetical protein MRS44_011336 [Fusarium solani]|uniref:uncharacterized protein n=1 Tax=Fusarium solani TaxID=169388 RepID=UPI0032C48811|nr:hypothetical protein MRS44_011336 [Fusarium solani]